MKKISIISFILLHSLTIIAQKRFVPSLKLGISTSQVDGDTYSGFHKAGIMGGAMLTANFNKKWSAEFEIMFVQKGSKNVPSSAAIDTGFYSLTLNYLEVPLMLQYHFKKFAFELGPGFGYLINYNEVVGSFDVTGNRPFKSYEISAGAGFRYLFYKNWGISCRYSNSLFSIHDFGGQVNQIYKDGERNNVLAFGLIYRFGPPQDQ